MPRMRITKTGRRLIYVGVAAYLIFLLHALPASILTRYVLPSIHTAQNLKLQDVRGSVWNGEASDARISNFDLGTLQWKIHSWGLLLGKLKMQLKFGEDRLQGSANVTVGMGGVLSADDVDMQFPAQRLMPLLYGYPMSIAGQFRGNLKQVTLEPGRLLQARGRIVWQDATIHGPQNVELGDYLITLEPQNSGSKIIVKDQGQGAVAAQITIYVKGSGEYRLNGWLKARDASQQSISEALRLIGRPDSSGRYWIGFTGRLRNWRK